MTQTILMICIGLLCVVSALCWWSNEGHVAAGICFMAFGIGYFALATVFAPVGG